jgi:predicted nucleic acid-binding protein
MKGRLISNTGPIIALSSIDHLEILKKIFKEVILKHLRECEMPVTGSMMIL